MIAFEQVLESERPALVIVVGDVNSTLACALVAAKRHVPLVHVEAGLRSLDRRMPEEINRVLTDRLADDLFVTEESGVGSRPCTAPPTSTPGRPSSAGSPPWSAWRGCGPSCSPATFAPASAWSLSASRRTWKASPPSTCSNPLAYLEFLRLMKEAAVVVTDSGSIQEETTFLGVPCLTLRETTERPVTVELGTNRLVPLEPEAIATAIGSILDGDRPPGKRPPLWDGRTAERIVEVLGGAHLAGPHAARAQLPASNHARAGPTQP